jgi:hypothetical protein
MTCNNCEKKDKCKKSCKPVNDILWKDNHVMEKHYADNIQVFPGSTRERHFSSLSDKQRDEISDADVFPWSSGDYSFTQTKVFVERFFNKVPCAELAKLYGVKENTIVCMYRNAVIRLDKIIKTLDARREGVKATKGTRGAKFTDDQKYFLLVNVFGFSGHEVARMFKLDQQIVNLKVKRMADKYSEAFKEPKKSVYDNLSAQQITERLAF